MCLRTVLSKTGDEFGVGYKIFYKNIDGLYCWFYLLRDSQREPYWVGVWNAAEDKRLEYGREICYEPGFHIFTRLQDAQQYLAELRVSEPLVIRRVVYDQAHTRGTEDDDLDVVVARRMLILPDVPAL